MSSQGTAREINVTPLIDVLLVLLIIFLVAIPILLRMQTVELPRLDLDAVPIKPPVTLRLHADGTIAIDDAAPVTRGAFATLLRAAATKTTPVFVDFDEGVLWSDVVSLVDSVVSITDGGQVSVRIRQPEMP